MTSDQEFIPTVAACRLYGAVDLPAAEANNLLKGLLSRISVRCGRIGVIGHNKANFRCGDDLLSISCTTEDGNVRSKTEFTDRVCDVEGVMDVIVYSADFHDLKHIIEDEASGTGLRAEVKEPEGCHDPDCHDPDCHDPRHRLVRFD